MATKNLSRNPRKAKPDLIFENYLSLFLIRPASPLGSSWLDENVIGEGTILLFGGAVPCESRYVLPIFEGAIKDGLVCR
jgi:hypothetical protein